MAKVKVRVAVAVATSGDWNSCGASFYGDIEKSRIAESGFGSSAVSYWLEAELDVPQETVVQAVVTKDGEP